MTMNSPLRGYDESAPRKVHTGMNFLWKRAGQYDQGEKAVMKQIFRRISAAVSAAALTFALSAAAPASEVKAEDAMGSGGRLYFSNGYSVALNWADPYDAYTVQAVTDAWDSAVEESWGGSTLIADHAYQGFSVIRSMGVGSTVTIADGWGGSATYVCISYYSNAYWTDGTTYLPDGRDAWYGDSSLWMKTCNADGTNTVSYWVQAW